MKKAGLLILSCILVISLVAVYVTQNSDTKKDDKNSSIITGNDNSAQTSSVSTSSSNNGIVSKENKEESSDITKKLFQAVRGREMKSRLNDESWSYLKAFDGYKEQFAGKNDAMITVPDAVVQKFTEISAKNSYIGNDIKNLWIQYGFGAKKDDTIVAVVNVTYGGHGGTNEVAKMNSYYVTMRLKANNEYEFLDIVTKFERERNVFRMYDSDHSNIEK